MSTLYMVATPIGNLEDMTYRAVRVLNEVDVIACEDTRHTNQLLSHFNIHKRLIACHAHNEEESSKGILDLLDQGLNIAYCSDAGTPGVSDPGSRLVEYVRMESEHKIVPLPGASASVTLISAAGRVGKAFTFEGFLSPKKGRRTKRLEELISRGDAFIIYESPFRVLKTVEEIKNLNSVKRLVIGRELTKTFEEIIVGSPEECVAHLKTKPSIKGEFAIVVVPGDTDDNDQEDSES
ncbi:MAG: 16S rRNA (cytidine(1402)-2'-O)-methyltransferase [Spirochaetales bacterium]|nr:16S rRNA (cytidine(1402)-2'-O)-methyltransferase [Spirochaetales bacterium]